MTTMSSEQLGRFGHHPDPADDFCIEVEEIEGEAYNLSVGFGNVTHKTLSDRVSKAMRFRVGGDVIAVGAKRRLREIEGLTERTKR